MPLIEFFIWKLKQNQVKLKAEKSDIFSFLDSNLNDFLATAGDFVSSS